MPLRYENEYLLLLDDGGTDTIWANSKKDAMQAAREFGLKPCGAKIVSESDPWGDEDWWAIEDQDEEFQREMFE